MFSYYLRQRGRKAEKSLNIKQDSGEKLVFVFSQVFRQKKNPVYYCRLPNSIY